MTVSPHTWKSVSRALFALLLVMLGNHAHTARAQNNNDGWVWIEAQDYAAINVEKNDKRKVEVGGWGNAQFLSGGSWFQVSVDEGNVEAQVPASGIVLNYKANLAKAGIYEIWNRIGYEFVRSPFEWRLDGGDWKEVAPDTLTTDLMSLQTWNEVAWLKLGDSELNAGAHTLDIRLPRQKDDKGKWQKVLYASDAILFHPGHFVPDGPNKPDEEFAQFGATERDKARQAAEAAAKNVFQLPQTAAGERAKVLLKGVWEVARNDEQTPPFDVAQPMQDFPTSPRWTAIAVPSDKNEARPDLLFAHRLWYRTRVHVAAGQIGRSFFLTFPLNNLNTTVYVNGTYCGFNKNPFARFSIDVTKAIKAGENEIRVGIRDAYYGLSTNPKNSLKLRRQFNTPIEVLNRGWGQFAYPVWDAFQSGILNTPEFVAAGPVYASDVFVKPSVARKRLEAEITLTNAGNQSTSGTVQWAAVNHKSGAVAKSFAPQPFTIAAGQEMVLNLGDGWDNAQLWWPEANPQLYRLRATILVGGQPVDVSETRFGFREWTIEGINLRLNGVIWHGWADTHTHPTKEQWLDFYRKTDQRFMRLWKSGNWYGLTPDDALDWLDENGVVVRRSGVMDGQALGMHPGEPDEDLKALYKQKFPNYANDIKLDLAANWKDQIVAQVKGERNHPSINMWSIENEWLFIATRNTGMLDRWEPVVTDVSRAVSAADPTRPNMTDGGGATKANTLPIHGDHYVFGNFPDYPAKAYLPNPTGGGWVWDQKRPRYIGEDVFAAGHNPHYSYFGGEPVFLGQEATKPAVGRAMNILTQGYRWAEYAAWHLWQGQGAAVGQYDSNAPLAVFSRQWDWTFGSGEKAKRTFGIFNDTFHTREPINFTRTLQVGGKTIWSKTTTHTVLPGENAKFDETLPMPIVAERQSGVLHLKLAVGGKTMFSDDKPLTILNPLSHLTAVNPAGAKAAPNTKRAMRVATIASAQTSPRLATGIAGLNAKTLAVYDPQGHATGFLKKAGIGFSTLKSLENLPVAVKVLLVGEDVMDMAQSTSTALAAYALGGRRVIVLEQKNPLKYQALPAEIEAAQNEGRTAFIEDATHPVLRHLQNEDFFTWGPDEVVYRNAYFKPVRGAKSLVQVDELLKHTALAEVPIGSGLMLLSQLTIGEKLASNVVAQQLMVNLLDYAANYKQEFRQVAAAINDAPLLVKALDTLGLQYTRAGDALAALNSKAKIAIIEGTPANLKVLSSNVAKVKSFNAAGGYIVLHGLTPAGLNDYNKLVGYEHMIRPMRRERVSFPSVKDPMTAGLSVSDVALYSSERIFPWQPGNYVASDTFSYVVDYDEVAPFAQSSSYLFPNAVGGFRQADGWKLINNFEAPASGPAEIPLTFPKPQTIREFTWVGNTLYNPQEKVGLLFDGKEKVAFDVEPNAEPQTFTLDPPRSGKNVTLQILDWQHLPDKKNNTSGRDLIGIDSLYLKAKRAPDFYKKVKPMLNIGGLMHYPRGAGGLILCNVQLKENEDLEENAAKKRNIVATILRNLKAPFAGGKTVIAGANLTYTSIDISKQANQYRTERGWFGDSNFTFKDLPAGRQKLANVAYDIYDFPTSPVPTVIMLGAGGIPNKLATEVKGIPVNQKADALFFLQAARIDARRNKDELRDNQKFEMARYIVNYIDGKQEIVPLFAEIDIEDYKQATPRALPGAQIGWTKPFAGTEFTAVAYSKQWNNPRPNVEIKSIDFTYGPDRRGVPVLLAITAAKAMK